MGSLPSKRGYAAMKSNTASSQISQTAEDKCVFVALYHFPLGGQADITIRFGEQLNILSEDGDWWKVASISTGKQCYMPRNYVAKVCNRWLYKGINREKAEELLMAGCNRSGSFLIRESETRKECFTLSIRQTNQATRDSIKHYRINRLENGWFYISPRLTYPTLRDMVDSYSEIADGMCCILKEPCIVQGVTTGAVHNFSEPVIVRKKTLNWKDLDSSALFNKDNKSSEDCPVSQGLRDAVSSYMFLTEDQNVETTAEKGRWRKPC